MDEDNLIREWSLNDDPFLKDLRVRLVERGHEAILDRIDDQWKLIYEHIKPLKATIRLLLPRFLRGRRVVREAEGAFRVHGYKVQQAVELGEEDDVLLSLYLHLRAQRQVEAAAFRLESFQLSKWEQKTFARLATREVMRCSDEIAELLLQVVQRSEGEQKE